VFSIVGLGELLGFVEHQPELAQYRQALQNYRNHYGV
jgi:hypothetical protein